jgi:hypothetical protein
VTGVAAVLLARNPNGISYMLSERLGPLLPWRRQPPAGPPAAESLEPEEEVVRVAAPVG